ncbi:MAG: inositol 2-dehydrogenase [Spirochaetia bacterium]|jgi:myo-inositol 2-dehydrogenase/D-chiro-inositol 1-dehydrogenase|nr:inositol 2-dehydrogenase [Spirochaetia bacterium]
MNKINIGVIGAGRIGKVHIHNITSSIPAMHIKTVVDPYITDTSRSFIKQCGIPNISEDPKDIFNDPEINAVLICSSTDTHAQFIIDAAKAKKNIFCEKPIAYDLEKVKQAIAEAEKAKVKLQIGFCRRFDHNHRAVHDIVEKGQIGKVQVIRITSRDPEPPAIEYVKASGGIFYDMMIHDFDMARFLAGSEAKEVYADGAVLIDSAIGEAGDVDTAAAMVRFENGVIAIIDNSRKAVYGYDQRVEVLGSEGMAYDTNDLPDTAVVSKGKATLCEHTYTVMWDRYAAAFVEEMKAFATALINGTEVPVPGEEGLYPILMATAANRSLKEHRPVKISEVEE